MTASLFTADLQPAFDYAAPGVTAPFRGARETHVNGWFKRWTGDGVFLGVPCPTVHKADDEPTFEYLPACFILAASVTPVVGPDGRKHLYHEGRTIQLADAMARGLAWRDGDK